MIALPAQLLAAVDKLVQQGKAASREELIQKAVRRELAEAGRRAVDAGFLGMADDLECQAEARQILAEFARADWEALQAGTDRGAERRQL